MLGPNKINVVENGAIVRVFLLEGAFPHGAPSDVLSKAGAFWESYGTRAQGAVNRRLRAC